MDAQEYAPGRGDRRRLPARRISHLHGGGQLDPESKRKLDEWQRQRIKLGIAAPGEAVGVYPYVADYNSVDRYKRFAADLAKRGWSEARLEKLMGGNFLRVYREVWGG